MTLEEAKEKLLLLLTSWEKSEIEDPWHVQDEAEFIEKQLIKAKLLQPQAETEGVAAQVDSVLNQLTNAQLQSVLPADIKVMKKLLESSELSIQKALLKHSDYWDSINYSSRDAKVQEYWFGKDT